MHTRISKKMGISSFWREMSLKLPEMYKRATIFSSEVHNSRKVVSVLKQLFVLDGFWQNALNAMLVFICGTIYTRKRWDFYV
ncbi:MAG: hypothetical protein RR087_01745 [Oscillospiraceae bacterium]